jgi:hypothetical protein
LCKNSENYSEKKDSVLKLILKQLRAQPPPSPFLSFSTSDKKNKQAKRKLEEEKTK